MTDFLELFHDSDLVAHDVLEEVRLSGTPTFVIAFSTETEETHLHYVEDPEIRRFVICPGPGRCPLCRIGDAASVYALLPVFSVDLGAVAVVRVSHAIGPGALGPTLRRVLSRHDAADLLVKIARNGSRYTVQADPLPDNADRGEREVAAFVAARKSGLKLDSAFASIPPEDLAEVPRVKRKLEAMGGFSVSNEDARDASVGNTDPSS